MHRVIRLLIALGASVALLGVAGGALGMTETAPGVVGVYNSTDSPTDLAVNSEGDLWVTYPNADVPRIARLNVLGVQQVSVPLTTPGRAAARHRHGRRRATRTSPTRTTTPSSCTEGAARCCTPTPTRTT